MTVIADYGLDQADQEELQTLSGADVEFGYMTDLTLANSEDAIQGCKGEQNVLMTFSSSLSL